MESILFRKSTLCLSHLTRGAWIEIAGKVVNVAEGLESHLTRGAWIEISLHSLTINQLIVAPHTRCVD